MDCWLTEAVFTPEQRRMLAEKGQALPDGSYPIRNRADLANAVAAFGRAKDKATVKAHIIRRARALGALDALPDAWGISEAAAEAVGAIEYLAEGSADLFDLLLVEQPDQPGSMPGAANGAVGLLQEAIALHQAHMDGTEPTSDASQQKLMDLIEAALAALIGSMPGAD